VRLYGTVTLNGRQWIIETEPQVALRIKRVFQKIKKNQYGKLTLSATPENTRELEWFLKRYPMTMEAVDKERLDELTVEHLETELLVGQILGGDYTAPVFELAVQPRDYQRISADLAMKTGRLLIADDVGLGKQQPVDAKVLTPYGYREIGSLKVGDMVTGSTGEPTMVTGVFPQGNRPCYRIKFSDHSSVECGPDHLWTVMYWKGGRKLDSIVVTSDQIRTSQKIKQTRASGQVSWLDLSKPTLFIPTLSWPARFAVSDAKLPIDPYLFGCLIANGDTKHTPRITINKSDHDDFMVALAAKRIEIGAIRRDKGSVHIGIPGVSKILRDMKLNVVSNQKFIPETYLHSRVENRIDLFHGLMDCDGTISKTGNKVAYCTTSITLASDFQNLAECLGCSATIHTYDRRSEDKPTEYVVSLRLPHYLAPFTTGRKSFRYKLTNRTHPTRSIESIEYTRHCESVCIKVAAQDSLYATEHAILTHNTAQAICTFTDPANLPALVVTLAHLPKQWQREVEKFAPKLRTHVIKKGTPYDICKGKNGEKVLFPDVILINYHKLTGWAETLAGIVKTVVYDEVQELRRSESLKYAGAIHISEAATLKIGLSATPIYNYGGEIYSVVSAIDPGCLGEKDEFMREWCDSYMSDRPKIRDPKAFGSYLREQGIMIRRTRSEVGRELEPLTKIPQAIEADPEALSNIEDSAAELAKIILSQNSLKKGVKMQAAEELSNIVRQATGIAKAPYVADFVRMLAEAEEPVLLYAWHREVYSILNAKLADLGPVMYTGSESSNQKAAAVQRFLNGESKILMMSLRAGAGLDGLQHVCRTVVFGELDWSPGVHDQCIGRVHRDGQTDPVMAYFLLSDYGSDPVMSDTLGEKRSQMQGIRDPNADLIEAGQASDHDVRKLAESFLRQRGLEIKEPTNLANIIQLRPNKDEQQETT